MNAPKSRWVGHGDATTWSAAANWRNGVPAAGVDAVFRNGATWSVDLGGKAAPVSAGALIVQGDALTLKHGVLMLAPQTADQGNTFDMILTRGAHVTVAAGAEVSGSNVAEIGAKGSSGTLTVLGLVHEEFGVVSNGSLDISGGHWFGGFSGVDLGGGSHLTVENGGTLDAGPDTFNRPASALFIADNAGDASALVTGAGSVVREAGVVLGSGYGSGTLTISDGGLVVDGYGEAGSYADGVVTVTGAGSTWDNKRSLRIGGQVPVSSSLTMTDGGTVSFGKYGFQLFGTLSMDASATLTGHTIVSGGAVIAAIPGGSGDVTLTQAFSLYYNTSAPDTTNTTYLEARAGTSLTLTGAISGASNKIVDAASGHVVLTNKHNAYGSTQIYAANLEIAATGAAGAGAISFVGGNTAASLTVDRGAVLGNLIAGFGDADTIDLRALDYAADIAATFSGGTLTLTSGAEQAVLHLSGSYTVDSFTLADDGFGGTVLGHH